MENTALLLFLGANRIPSCTSSNRYFRACRSPKLRNTLKCRPRNNVTSLSHAYHFKRIFSFGEGHRMEGSSFKVRKKAFGCGDFQHPPRPRINLSADRAAATLEICFPPAVAL